MAAAASAQASLFLFVSVARTGASLRFCNDVEGGGAGPEVGNDPRSRAHHVGRSVQNPTWHRLEWTCRQLAVRTPVGHRFSDGRSRPQGGRRRRAARQFRAAHSSVALAANDPGHFCDGETCRCQASVTSITCSPSVLTSSEWRMGRHSKSMSRPAAPAVRFRLRRFCRPRPAPPRSGVADASAAHTAAASGGLRLARRRVIVIRKAGDRAVAVAP